MKTKNSLIAQILGVITALIIVVTMFTIPNTNFFDIPFFAVLGRENIEEAKLQFEDSADLMEDELDKASDEEIEDVEEQLGIKIDDFIEIMRSPSLNGIIKISNVLKEGIETDLFDASDIGVDDELLNLFSTIKAVIYVYAAIILLFIVLGIFTKKTVFPIIAIVISFLYFLCLAGIILYAVFIAAAAFEMVYLLKAKKENAATINY